MTPQTVMAIGQGALEMTLMISAPLLLSALIVGLVVSVFQAATQINEMTLSFIPKLVAIFAEMGVPVSGVRLGGGGARSALWRQIQADVYGHPAEIVEAEEGAAYGAAILAGVGAGGWPSVEAACTAIVRVAARVPPQPAAVAAMRQR